MTAIHSRWIRAAATASAVIFVMSTNASAAATGAAAKSVTAADNGISYGAADKAAEKLLPEKYGKKGSLTIAVSATHPPNAFFDKDSKLVGWEVELGDAITTRLGLKPDFEKVEFSQILTGLQSGRYDLGLSGISDTVARQKVVTFVDYFDSAGTSLVVKNGNPKKLTSLADLCGTSVAIETGTIQVEMARDQSKKCEADGKKAIDIKTFPAETQVQLQIRSGRADAGLNDFPVAAYIAKRSDGQLEAVHHEGTAPAYYGIAITKDSSGLVKAVQAAVQSIVDDGTYMKILKRWNLQEGAIKKVTINGTDK